LEREITLMIEVDTIILNYESKLKNAYSIALFFRVIIGVFSFFSVLPDSAFIKWESMEYYYPLITTTSGIIAAVSYILIRNIRLEESLSTYKDCLIYLHSKRKDMIIMDNLEQEKQLIEIKHQLHVKKQQIYKDILKDIEVSGTISKG